MIWLVNGAEGLMKSTGSFIRWKKIIWSYIPADIIIKAEYPLDQTKIFSSVTGNGRLISEYVYFAGTLDAAVWGAELAEGEDRERIYVVEPSGSYEDDPNLTDNKFPGNPTKSYRSKHPLKIVAEVTKWEGHSPELLYNMMEHLKKISKKGIKAID